MDRVISTKTLQVERKSFLLDYRENDRGQFLRIIEDSHGRRNTIIVPSGGLSDFLDTLEELLAVVDEANAEGSPAAPTEGA